MIQRVLDTKGRILDAAEKLFGDNGFDATSLRDITAQADVNLAAVNYHFQTKESLIDAVIARRIEPVNRKRLEMLEAAGADPAVEQILIAFLSPVFDQDRSAVAPMMAQILATPDVFITRLFKKHLATVSQRFTEALGKALPGLSRTDLLWRLHFTAGAMAHVLARGHLLPEMTHGECDPTDRPAVLARLITFTAAGLRANAWNGEAN